MQRDKTYQLYQVILDLGKQINSLLVIHPYKVTSEIYQHYQKRDALYRDGKDIKLDFGITPVSFRFVGVTDDYASIYDLVTKVIYTAVDQTSQALLNKENNSDVKDQLINSINNAQLFYPEGFIVPSGLLSMFRDQSTIHAISFTLAENGVGRLADMLKAGKYNLTHTD